MCRKDAWTELTVKVTPMGLIQSRTHGLKIYIDNKTVSDNSGTFFISDKELSEKFKSHDVYFLSVYNQHKNFVLY